MQHGSFLTSYFQVPDNINLLQFYLNFEKKNQIKKKIHGAIFLAQHQKQIT